MAEGPKLENDVPVYCKSRDISAQGGIAARGGGECELARAERPFEDARRGSWIESGKNEEWEEPCDWKEEEAA